MEVSPDDAAALGLEPDDWVVVESRRGKMPARVFVTPTVQPGQVFVPMHLATTNLLTAPAEGREGRSHSLSAGARSGRL